MNKCMKIEPNIKNLNLYWFVKELSSYGYSRKTIFNSTLVLEELLVNIILYSCTKKPIILNFILSAHEIKIRLADEGVKFNPLNDFKADLNSNIENKKIGGLGIHIAKNLSKSFIYKRIGRFNILALSLDAILSDKQSFKNKPNDVESSTIHFIFNTNMAII